MDQRTKDFFSKADEHRVRMTEISARSGVLMTSLSRWRNNLANPISSNLTRAERALDEIIRERAATR